MTDTGQAIERPHRFSIHTTLIVAVYVSLFFVALPAFLWGLGGRLDLLLALPSVGGVLMRGIGVAVGALGVIWMAGSTWILWQAGAGLPISHLPPTRLTISGPYTTMRHPIYVGYVAAFAGAGASAGSIGRSIIAASVLAWGSVIYALGFEEERLQRRFGAAYIAYRGTTPAFALRLPAALGVPLIDLWLRCRPVAERVANHIVLARIGSTTWVTYGLFAMAAAGVILTLIAAALVADGVARPLTTWYLIGLACAVPVGARAMWLTYHLDRLWVEPRPTLRQVGFVSWGGAIGLFGFSAGFAWVTHLAVLRLWDSAAFAGVAGLAVARIGCFTYGCCYGRPSPLGIRWTNPEAKPIRENGAGGDVARVPTPLLSSAAAAVVFAMMIPVLRRHVPLGVVAGLTFVAYGATQFAIECLRADPRHGTWQLTQGQWGSIVIAGVGALLLFAVPSADSAQVGLHFDFAGVLPLAPILAACMIIVFVVYGLHWREVGRW